MKVITTAIYASAATTTTGWVSQPMTSEMITTIPTVPMIVVEAGGSTVVTGHV